MLQKAKDSKGKGKGKGKKGKTGKSAVVLSHALSMDELQRQITEGELEQEIEIEDLIAAWEAQGATMATPAAPSAYDYEPLCSDRFPLGVPAAARDAETGDWTLCKKGEN